MTTEPISTRDGDTVDDIGTGDARVDAARGRLATLDELPVADHVGVYDEVNRLLQDALADLDEER